MKFSRDEKALITLAQTPLPRGQYIACDLIHTYDQDAKQRRKLDCDFAAEKLDPLLDYIQRNSKMGAWGGPRNVWVNGAKTSYALTGLARHAGGTRGRDCMDRAYKALAGFKASGVKALTVWLTEFRKETVNDQEGLFFLLHTAAWHLELPVRLVGLVGQVSVYNRKLGHDETRDCQLSMLLRAHVHQLTRAGLAAYEGDESNEIHEELERRKLA